MTRTITRFAPSPTGRLHLGHAYSALFAHRQATASGGVMLLRIEDIDPARCRAEHEANIHDDLVWLMGERVWPLPVRRQSEHMGDYSAALARLDAMGVLYPCFCTRKEIAAEIARMGAAPHAADGAMLYPGTCRGLSADERAARMALDSYAWRIDAHKAAGIAGALAFTDRKRGHIAVDPHALGDAVLARKDAPASYHLCVTVDDALQNATLVTRAEDLLAATHLHRLLQALLDLPEPLWHHHGLLRNAAGERLSKRDGATALADLRAHGMRPEALRRDLLARIDAESNA